MEERYIMFRNRLTKVYRHLGKQARRSSVTCYRIYDHDLPEFPFCIELYEKKLYVAEYLRRHGMTHEEHEVWLNSCVKIMEEVLAIPASDIFLKLRKRKAGRKDQYRVQSTFGQSSVSQSQPQPSTNQPAASSLQPAASSHQPAAGSQQRAASNQQPSTSNQQPATGNQQPATTNSFLLNYNEFLVYEAGLKFIVNLSDYLDTGLFLDHRITRQMVREQSMGKKVLNLFAYTGSFSVYAADGKATEVHSLDLSRTYLDWAKRNFELNAFTDTDKYKFIQTDVLQWLQDIPAEQFDLVILDPPTFSNSQRMEDILDIQRDHDSMINKCLVGLKPGGKIYFSTNYRQFKLNSEKINSQSIKDITKATTPFDFEGRLDRKCFMIGK